MIKAFLILTLTLSSLSLAKVAPSFQGEAMGGGKVTLKDKLKKDRVLLLSFWATWCTPCLEELNQVSTKMKAEPQLPLDLLTVNVDTSETASDVKPTLKLHKFEMPVVLDPKHEIFAKYHDAKSLPFSVLIGANGNIEATFNGYHEDMFAKIKEAIAAQAKTSKETNAKTKS